MFFVKCLIFFGSAVSYSTSIPGDYVVVETKNGFVRGEESITELNTTNFIFRGIRYAKPPLGYLRFKAPLPAENWTGIHNATSEGSMCTSSQNTTVVGSEDCLFLNIYTLKLPTNTSEPKLPCIVWIHGGAFVFGSGNLGLHGADRFLDHGVCVISINYRLGIFGFLSTEDSSSPGNYGLKDQIEALRWIKKNIKYFGGDPNNITIMGESAGAASVHFLLEAEIASGLFQKAISESGCSLVPWSKARNARRLAFRVGVANLIITTDSKTLIQQLRGVNYKTLQESAFVPQILALSNPLNGLPLAPCKEAKSPEAVVTEDSYEALKYGHFNRVPLLTGFNSLEARVPKDLPWYGILFLQQYNLFPGRLVPDDMNPSNSGRNEAATKIKSFYFQNRSVVHDQDYVYYTTDAEFVRGIRKMAQFTSKYVPVHFYNFSFTGGIEHESFMPEGVSHAEELQFLWLSNNTVQRTPAAKLTVCRMVEMWANFAKTGNPTSTLSEAVNVSWPLVNGTNDKNIHYLNIGDRLVPKINPDEEAMKFWDNLYNEYGFPPYDTY